MSGFAAVANLDGAPGDRDVMQRLVDALVFRGPDAQDMWIGRPVMLGHALFQTTDLATPERQPCSLDGATWISGDIRVDRRADLVADLRHAGRAPAAAATDPELVLHAYLAWGEGLLDRLIGDFSFAIWDGARQRLFCARDQLGVRPFFYARTARHLIVSNTLSCVRSHPAVSADLNEQAIGDFLLFGFNADAATTSFTAINRLPAGHALTWSPGGEPRIRRYWALPVYDELRLKRPGDYVERFRGLLDAATSDRLRIDRVGVHMSGGIDSCLIAATAHRIAAARGSPAELRAHTIVYDRLFDDPERHFAGLAAAHLDIPIEYLVADSYGIFDGERDPLRRFPEPFEAHAQTGQLEAFNRQVAAGGRVALTGLDGDALLTASWQSQLAESARHRDVAALVKGGIDFLGAKLDLPGALRRRLRPSPRRVCAGPAYPAWIEPGFARRTQLKDRWEAKARQVSTGRSHPRRGAYAAMGARNWLATFEGLDAGTTGIPLDRRHPMLDLRVVEFCLSLPAIPWCVDKHILRAAGRGQLPRAVLDRPKAPLAGDPLPQAIRRYWAGHDGFEPHPALARFVNFANTGDLIDEANSDGYWFALRGVVLNRWLHSQ